MITRAPLGTWETLPSPLSKPAGDTGIPTPGRSTAPRPGPMGDKQRSHRWYRQAKETKCGEMGGRESQRLISRAEAGERALPDPVAILFGTKLALDS